MLSSANVTCPSSFPLVEVKSKNEVEKKQKNLASLAAEEVMLLFCLGISFTFCFSASEVRHVLYFSKQGKTGIH